MDFSKDELAAIYESIEGDVEFLKRVQRRVPGIAIARGNAVLVGVQAKIQDELERRAKVEREEAVKPKMEKVD